MSNNNFGDFNSHLGDEFDEWYDAHKGMSKKEILIEFVNKYGIGIKPVIWKIKLKKVG